MKSIRFGTKAETLQALQDMGFSVPDLYYFNLTRWAAEHATIVEEIQDRFSNDVKVVIRSSSQVEDGSDSSMAGAFESILDISPQDGKALRDAIEMVINSFDDDPDNQILIQPMLADVVASGVIMTRCVEHGSPYYVINYDDESGRTDSVTGGMGESKTVFVYRGVKDSDFDSERVRAMISFTREIEKVFGTTPLDIEFGLDRAGQMHVFQVRRICTQDGWMPDAEQRVADNIRHIERFVGNCLRARPGIYGRTSVLGVMPDWNPAEIIGVTPRPLAASLYREIITKRVWSLAREDMGYRSMPPEELMVMVAGRPYIDVRNSFNSFLPKGLSDATGEKLVEAWLNRLDSHPELHDKVEFDVALTVHDLNFDKIMDTRYKALLESHELTEFKMRLLQLTNDNLNPEDSGTLARAERDIGTLANLQQTSDRCFKGFSPFETLCRVKTLLEECRRYGTRPFSILARHGFIAESFMRSAVDRGAMELSRINDFKRTIQTVSGQMATDFRNVVDGALDQNIFLQTFGHLRPGTYDILSPRYADRESLFEHTVDMHAQNGREDFFALTNQERQALDRLLLENGIVAVTAEGLFDYMRRAVAGREYGKLVFTRNLSDALECLARWGESMGYTREDVSYLSLHEILESLISPIESEAREHFDSLIERGRKLCELACSFRFNYLIRSPRDLYVVPQHRSAPNFITCDRVEGRVAMVNSHCQDTADIAGRIVCIENADPGFDWIFTKGIAGLVTKYGGANSHMAIRCAEFGLPAAIGCGEMLFERISSASHCEVNACDNVLRPL